MVFATAFERHLPDIVVNNWLC